MSPKALYAWAQETARTQPGFEATVCTSGDCFGDGRVLAAIANAGQPGLVQLQASDLSPERHQARTSLGSITIGALVNRE